jgi:dTDP-4-amino-4,6-dideoxygalactose transaminase
MEVPFIDLKAQHQSIKSKILPKWEEILEKAAFVGGPYLDAFEKRFAEHCGAEQCIAVSSGTDALLLIFDAMGIGVGDEVIVPDNTFIATAEAVSKVGGTPVFVDVKSDTYNIDPEKIEAAITPRTKCIVPVHLYGQTADMDAILEIGERRGIPIVEDAAQAHLAEYKGRRAGSMGIAAGFSFYPGKNLGACGEAGAITTSDSKLADSIRQLRDHGSSQKYVHQQVGYNSRCDALQSAALLVKLDHLPAWNEARRANARLYLGQLEAEEGIYLPTIDRDCLPVWHLFVIQVEDRNAVQRELRDRGIASALHYPIPLHMQEAYKHLGYDRGAFPVSEAYTERLLSLPMYPELSADQIHYVCENLKELVAGKPITKGVALAG